MILFLALLLALVSLGVSLTLMRRLNVLNERLMTLERRPQAASLETRQGKSPGGELAGIRIALEIQQDHSHPVFANLLKEALLREEAIVDAKDPDLRIAGEIVGNGYADVYFRAELTAQRGEETLFTVSERPPHGDRPANLAAEIVQRLKDEVAKRERRLAIRELHGSE